MANEAYRLEQTLADGRGTLFDTFVDKTEPHFLWLTELQQQLEREAIEDPVSYVLSFVLLFSFIPKDHPFPPLLLRRL